MTRTFDSIAMAAVLVLSASLVGVVVAAPLAAGTAEASTASASPHGADANFTAKPDNHAPGVTTANEFYASGIREEITMHTIVVRSEAFDFDSCSASQVRAFGIDRGNDDPGTETDESLLGSYKSIEFEKNQITVKFYKEDRLAGGPVKVAPEDQIVARGDDCLTNPSEPGWYQINGKINGSTNDDTTTDFSQSTTSHYIYVCDCDSRQEAEEKLGPPPSQESDGDSGSSDTATATPTESSGDSGGSEGDGGTSETATPTATPTESSGDSGGSEGDGGTSDTATATDSGNQESQGTPTTTAGAGDTGDSTTTTSTTGDGTGTNATSTGGTGGDGTTGNASTGNESGGGGFASNDTGGESTTPSGGQPGFGLLAALGALGVAGLLAKRRSD